MPLSIETLNLIVYCDAYRENSTQSRTRLDHLQTFLNHFHFNLSFLVKVHPDQFQIRYLFYQLELDHVDPIPLSVKVIQIINIQDVLGPAINHS